MERIVPPKKGNQVGFPRTRVTHRILLDFISMEVFYLYSSYFLLTTPLVLLGRRIPYCPSQAFGEFQGLESDPQGRDLPTQGWPTSSSSRHSWIQALHQTFSKFEKCY